jgi:hypothetical protein
MDEWTGEVWQQRLPAEPAEIGRWLESLPQPVKAAYEAGPTGFGLARFLNGRGIVCVVAAPSKLQRPAGNRIKPMPGMQSCCAGCYDSMRSSRCPCLMWSRRRLGIWCGPEKTSAVI